MKSVFSRVPMGNYFWWYSRQLFVLAFGKCKRNVNILIIILVRDFRLKLKLLAISYRISFYCALMPFFLLNFITSQINCTMSDNLF